MHNVKIEWLTCEEGGRKNIPPKGKYFSVARFPEDINWQNNAGVLFLSLNHQCMSVEKA